MPYPLAVRPLTVTVGVVDDPPNIAKPCLNNLVSGVLLELLVRRTLAKPVVVMVAEVELLTPATS